MVQLTSHCAGVLQTRPASACLHQHQQTAMRVTVLSGVSSIHSRNESIDHDVLSPAPLKGQICNSKHHPRLLKYSACSGQGKGMADNNVVGPQLLKSIAEFSSTASPATNLKTHSAHDHQDSAFHVPVQLPQVGCGSLIYNRHCLCWDEEHIHKSYEAYGSH